ncbi:MAG: ribosome biogenesis GTP-binding protein YsxC [Deltaproteobacteria bacterium]|nr:ribosome biogenesis GTP-binding protein YsxC [Deltaproteobacteria bacterium]
MTPRAEFIAAAGSAKQFPPEGPSEVAFAGRSNVGKSSLLNALAGTGVARVSKAPGRTRTINFFHIRSDGRPPRIASNTVELALVDLPGYGFARRSKAERGSWKTLVEGYLKRRGTLRLCVLLIDANVPPQALDGQMIDWLRAAGLPFLLVGTKIDRLSKSRRTPATDSLARAFEAEVLPVSARSGLGIDELWRRINAAGMLRDCRDARNGV